MFWKYYGQDPMKLDYDRFITMYGKINKIEANFRGKSEIEMALEMREAELEEEKIEELREKGVEFNNPLIDPMLE
jgi:hypothetical protein